MKARVPTSPTTNISRAAAPMRARSRASKSGHFALASQLLRHVAMTRAAALSIAIFAACTSGDAPGPDNTLGRTCSATLAISGSFVLGQPAPTNPDGSPYTGCWPIGTWTFSATVGDSDCSAAPTLLPSYSFVGTTGSDSDGDFTESFAYTTDPTAHAIIKVTEAGNAQCEGELDLFSTDGMTEWDLSPWLNTDHSITGEGMYSQYTTDQWVGSGS